jgi:hypothetical protein
VLQIALSFSEGAGVKERGAVQAPGTSSIGVAQAP